MIVLSFKSLTIVPKGTLTITSFLDSPNILFGLPSAPLSPLIIFEKRKSNSVDLLVSTSNTIEAPSPPSPPFGPPKGLYFSRLKETRPLPPFPAFNLIFTLSINCIILLNKIKGP